MLNRPFWLIKRNILRQDNYVALVRALQVYEHPLKTASQYFFGNGSYPCSVRVRTPIGWQEVKLFHNSDIFTLHEIFCREDYRCPSPPQVVLDLGSNIGISALYFLTRSQSTYCELYEPDPRNLSKLLSNLKGFDQRFTVHEVAVADKQGKLPFTVEETGRYGSLVGPGPEGAIEGDDKDVINVNVEHINVVLERTIARHGSVDLLKIDTEGCELATIQAIDPTLLSHVGRIVIEWFDKTLELDGFRVRSSCDTVTFSRSRT